MPPLSGKQVCEIGAAAFEDADAHQAQQARDEVQRCLEAAVVADATGKVSGKEALIGKQLLRAAHTRLPTAFRVCGVNPRDLQVAKESGDVSALAASKALDDAAELFATRLGKIGSRAVACCPPVLTPGRYGYLVTQFCVTPLPGSVLGDKREEVLALLCIVDKHGCLHGEIIPWAEAKLRPLGGG